MKILHCADIHLGYETHGRLDPETGLNTRLLDFRRCFDVMVERALAERVDLFLFCGDAYRTPDPTPTQQKLFAEALAPVAEAGIPIVMIVGNHDHPVSFGKASSVDIFPHLRGDVHVFRRPDSARIETKAGPLQLIALPWPIRSVLLSKEVHRGKTPHEIREHIEELYADFVTAAARELDPALPAVVAAHLSIQGAELGGSERASLIAHEPKLTVGQLAAPGVDYVALGHIHKFQDRNADAFARGEGPPVVYSSSIERISFKEHDAPKGFVLVDIEAGPGGKTTRFEFVETPARRFIPIEVDARETVDPTTVILNAIARHDIDDAVVRVRYRVTEKEAPLVDPQAIREALKTADTIAAVERAVDPVERQRRTTVRRETSLSDAIERYVDQHEQLAPLKSELVAAALEIEREVDGVGTEA
ncbi:MAG TPA: exonuclease SbcCD subunit D [Rhodothermales bacterium]|nr:exonuclease SbcCD subunit D [Rhodothermales bacterium]